MNAPKSISFRQRPLLSPDQVAGEAIYVAILRLANALTKDFDELFKEHGLTNPQYNVLRVLRDAGEAGMTCQDVSHCLISRDPDITRLTDRLEERGLLVKQRGTKDRRVIHLRLTQAGLQLMADLDIPVSELHSAHASVLSLKDKQELLHQLQQLLKSGDCTALQHHN